MQKNHKTSEDIFWVFTDFHGSYAGPKSDLHPRTEISSMELLTPKSSIKKIIIKLESPTI